MSAAPTRPREKAAPEAGIDDTAPANDEGGGAKKRWRQRHHGQRRNKAKKAKKDEEKAKKAEDIPKNTDEPLSKQESSVTLKPAKPRPNVFLALRLTNPEIQSNVRRFQECFLTDNPKLGRLCVPVQKSHVSLQVLNIKEDDEVEVQMMLDAMRSASSVMDNTPISMTFSGTRSFGKGRVVFAAMTEGVDAVRALYASLQESIAAAGYDSGKLDASRFHPHLTLLKSSR